VGKGGLDPATQRRAHEVRRQPSSACRCLEKNSSLQLVTDEFAAFPGRGAFSANSFNLDFVQASQRARRQSLGGTRHTLSPDLEIGASLER
jgi:hypothetical protein